MVQRVSGVIVLVAAAILIATQIDAGPPDKAKKFKGELVTAYDACSGGLTSLTPNLGLPACTPAQSNPTCGWDPAGGGKGTAQAALKGGSDIKIKSKMKGLDVGCDGLTLQAVADIRLTTDGCTGPAARCTSVNLSSFQLGTCVAAGGQCAINTTVNTGFPGAITAGNRLEVEIMEVRIEDAFFVPVFRVGLLVP